MSAYPQTPYGGSARVPPRRIGWAALDRDAPLRRLDWVLLAAVVGLLVVGSLLVWSATRQAAIDSGGDPQAYLKKHVLNIFIGTGLGVCAAMFDYRTLRMYAPIVYGLSIVGLLVVLSPLGATIRGSHSWILLPGGFSLQPSEFAKVALVVGLAMLLSEKRDAEDSPRDTDVLLVLVGAAVPLALIMLQPDLGTALVVSSIVIGMIAVSGARIRWVVGLLLAAAVVAFAVVQAGLLDDYQVKRLTAFVNPGDDPGGAAYNVSQGVIAIGGGGLDGHGLFHGPQTQGGFVPEQQTDFIFTTAGEELGFRGGILLIALLGLILWRACRIAWHADDLFGRLVAVGVVCWFSFQAFENIGMTLGIMPVTGVPLPFVSYGGSSMFANLVAIGLLQNVHVRRSLLPD
ncbi:rod shape-determining protein RodA [Motilibacter deserti]|uniref:Peptidoglycan glycosyltransferase RodA n=1 Tax=Motilibacter deserti TaxID=2714956 RepID=A0ABX0GQF0_9ACTN|nr:rod shape-determining protein RodA [Motilibacter deserti]NHC12698.1 rod shape-determining protein RodA [Motilibacter deserti]